MIITADPIYCSSHNPTEISYLNNELNSNNMTLPAELFQRRTLNLSIEEQLQGVLNNLEKYRIQEIKFINIIENIDNNTELFYPTESKNLFIEYLDLLKVLIDDLISREFNLLTNLPLPQPTAEETVSLLYSDGTLSSYPTDTSIPVQPEEYSSTLSEEISSFESEDYMNDVIHMGMFDEKDL